MAKETPAPPDQFNAIVTDVWRDRGVGLQEAHEQIKRRQRMAEERVEALERAFIFERRIDQTSYDRQKG
jgi:hypothetical protein